MDGPDGATEHLERLLAAGADEASRRHWERYLRGAASFRGVPMAGIRRAITTVWVEDGLAGRSTADLLDLAARWFARPMSEDKLAAVLLIAERLAERLDDGDRAALARPFAEGSVTDWNVCDWYSTKALHAFLVAGDRLERRAPALAAWTASSDLWQRRAGLVAFVKLAPHADRHYDGFVDLVLAACANNLVSTDRFAQTGPGWVLRELSRAEPEAVTRFVAAHPEMTPEARRMATARLRPGRYRRR